MDYDFFISHASEDKDTVVRPLAEALTLRGYRVWYDEYCLKVGDSLSSGIDQGLAASKFGIVVLSPAFFRKHWTQRELRGLVALDEQGRSKILPVWHNVTKDDVVKASPTLADIIAANTAGGLPEVVEAIAGAAGPQRPLDLHGARTESSMAPTVNVPTHDRGHAVFVHGFFEFEHRGLDLLALLAKDPKLNGWHLGEFQRSPGRHATLDEAANELMAFMEGQVFRLGDGCALIAHSTGGLVAQQAILRSQLLADRLTALILLGVPSAGLKVSSLIGFFRQPLRNFDASRAAVATIRATWDDRFGKRPPFDVWAVAAERDEIVPPESSLEPFPPSHRFVVPGSHDSMIRPHSENEPVVRLVARALLGPHIS